MSDDLTRSLAAWIDFRAPGREALETFFAQRAPVELAANPTVHRDTVDRLITLGTRDADEARWVLAPLLKSHVLSPKQRQSVITSGILQTAPAALTNVLLEFQQLSPRDITSLIALPEVAAEVATYVLRRPARFRTEKRGDLETLLDLCMSPTTRLAWLARVPDRFNDRVGEWLTDASDVSSLFLEAVAWLLEARPDLMDALLNSELPILDTLARSRHLRRLDHQLRIVGLDQLPRRTMSVEEWLTQHYCTALALVGNPRCHRDVLERMLDILHSHPRLPRSDYDTLNATVQDRLRNFERRGTVVEEYEELSDFATISWLTERSQSWSRTKKTSFERRLDAAALLRNPNVPSWYNSGLRRNAAKTDYVTLLKGRDQYALAEGPKDGQRHMTQICDGRCRPDPSDPNQTLRADPELGVLALGSWHHRICTMSAWATGDVASSERVNLMERFVRQTFTAPSSPWWYQSGASFRAAASQLVESLGNSPRVLETFLGLQDGWQIGVGEMFETALLLAAN